MRTITSSDIGLQECVAEYVQSSKQRPSDEVQTKLNQNSNQQMDGKSNRV